MIFDNKSNDHGDNGIRVNPCDGDRVNMHMTNGNRIDWDGVDMCGVNGCAISEYFHRGAVCVPVEDNRDNFTGLDACGFGVDRGKVRL